MSDATRPPAEPPDPLENHAASILALAIVEAELRVNQGDRSLADVADSDDPNWKDREQLLNAAATEDPRQTIHLLAHMLAVAMRHAWQGDALEWLDRIRWGILHRDLEDGDRA